MIGALPSDLEIGGELYPIRSDYRVALLIFQAMEDPELTEQEKALALLSCLYEDWESIPQECLEEACNKAVWFLDGGDMAKSEIHVKTLDWEQDESMIFAAVNKSAGKEIRELPFLHWWSFLGFFSESGETLLSTIMHIRYKRGRGKPLDKQERQFYIEHKDMIDIKKKLSKAEKEENDFVNSLFEGS